MLSTLHRLPPSFLALVLLLVSMSPASAGDGVFPVPANWFSGDVHIHWPASCAGVSEPSGILANMPADLNFASVLIWCGGGIALFEQTAEAYFMGKVDNPVSTATQIVHYDLEVSACGMADLLGHVNYLYLDDIYFPQSNYHGPIQDWAHAQGAYVGFDHCQWFAQNYSQFPSLTGCCRPYEVPVDVALGRVDYLTYQPTLTEGWRFLYYTLLDCGFRPGLAASTDSFCLPFPIGSVRTYAFLRNGMTYGNFVAGLAAGRVTTVEDYDNFLHFTVDGNEVGDQLDVTNGTTLNLQARVLLPAFAPRQGTVEIVSNGQVIASQAYSQVGGEVLLTFQDTIRKSSWYSARTEKSHTGAVYVHVDGYPIRSSVQSAQYYVDYMDWFAPLVAGGQWPHLTKADQLALLADIAQAKAVFEQIKLEAEQPVPVEGSLPQSVFVSVAPNPFRENTSISFALDRPMPVDVDIFRLDGRVVRRLTRAHGAGPGRIEWDGRDASGSPVATGVYLYRVATPARTIGEGKLLRIR